MSKNQRQTEETIEKLDAEISKHEDTIRELDGQRLERQKQKQKLLDDRCDLNARIIFSDVEVLIQGYLKLIGFFDSLKEKAEALNLQDPQWYRRAEQQGKHSLFTTIADSFLRIDRLRGESLGEFMNKICAVNEGLTDSPYPKLKR